MGALPILPTMMPWRSWDGVPLTRQHKEFQERLVGNIALVGQCLELIQKRFCSRSEIVSVDGLSFGKIILRLFE